MTSTYLRTEAVQEIPGSDLGIRIAARNVCQVFDTRKTRTREAGQFVAIEDLSLDVYTGEFLTIVGPSGCGKSTFLDMVAGLVHPTSGQLSIDGKPITGPALDRGIVMQGYALFPWRNVHRNIEFGLEIKGVPKKERRAIGQKYIELVGLQGFEDRYAYELSGGMKQRVAIARALAYDPEVLLMDEPFAAVDAQTREVLQDELLRIWEETGKTIIFVTHSIDEAVFLADRVAIMATNPGYIKQIIDLDLPRPRKYSEISSSPAFKWLTRQVWELLHDQGEAETEESFSDDDSADEYAEQAV